MTGKKHMLYRFAQGNPGGSRWVALAHGDSQCSKRGVAEDRLTEIVEAVTCGNCRKSLVGMARVTQGIWEAWLELRREKSCGTA